MFRTWHQHDWPNGLFLCLSFLVFVCEATGVMEKLLKDSRENNTAKMASSGINCTKGRYRYSSALLVRPLNWDHEARGSNPAEGFLKGFGSQSWGSRAWYSRSTTSLLDCLFKKTEIANERPSGWDNVLAHVVSSTCDGPIPLLEWNKTIQVAPSCTRRRNN